MALYLGHPLSEYAPYQVGFEQQTVGSLAHLTLRGDVGMIWVSRWVQWL